jgi:hypothetical protein
VGRPAIITSAASREVFHHRITSVTVSAFKLGVYRGDAGLSATRRMPRPWSITPRHVNLTGMRDSEKMLFVPGKFGCGNGPLFIIIGSYLWSITAALAGRFVCSRWSPISDVIELFGEP